MPGQFVLSQIKKSFYLFKLLVMTTKKVFFIFLLLIPILVYAQERKIYKGSYDFARQHGDVEYEYVEGSNGRIFDGVFKFKYGDIRMEGSFKNNIKEGTWVYYLRDNIVSKRTFKNGKLEGDYISKGFSKEGSHRDINVKFKDNHLVGSFEYEEYTAGYASNGLFSASEISGLVKYTGQFDENGYATGIWIKTYKNPSGISFVEKKLFEEGYMSSATLYNESTGETKDLLTSGYLGQYVWKQSIDRTTSARIMYHPIQAEFSDPYTGHTNSGGENSYGKGGFNFGEYPPRCPILGYTQVKKEREQKEQKRIEEEREWQAQQEKERQAKAEQREKDIQIAINNFDNSIFGKILSDIRVRMNNGKTFEEAKQEAVSSQIMPFLVPMFEDKTTITGLGMPLQVDYSNRDYLGVSMSLLIVDNEKGWITREATNNGTVKFQHINSIDLRSPCIFYESDGLIIGIDNNKDFYIAQKKGNKTKKTEKIQMLNTQSISRGTRIEKGIYYKIERSSDGFTDRKNFIDTLSFLRLSDSRKRLTDSRSKVESYTDLADFLKTITLEEVNTPTKTRIEKKLNNTKK